MKCIPEGVIVFKEKDDPSIVEIDQERLVTVSSGTNPDKRTAGRFENVSYYLISEYDWIIVKDEVGQTCLVPLKKN